MNNLIYYTENKNVSIEQLQIYLGELFIKDGLTEEVIKLSQELDEYIVKSQVNKLKKDINFKNIS